MSSGAEPRIVVVDWDRFQHVDVTRGSGAPPWIKNYTRLLDDDDYLELTAPQRGLLHGLWLLYAKSRPTNAERTSSEPRTITGRTSKLSRRLGLRVSNAQLIALEQAGFIRILASNVQAERKQDASALARGREEVEEEEEEKASHSRAVVRPLVHDPDSDLTERDKAHEEEEPFAIGPEPALPRNGATADEHGPQPLEPDQLLERWRTA